MHLHHWSRSLVLELSDLEAQASEATETNMPEEVCRDLQGPRTQCSRAPGQAHPPPVDSVSFLGVRCVWLPSLAVPSEDSREGCEMWWWWPPDPPAAQGLSPALVWGPGGRPVSAYTSPASS